MLRVIWAVVDRVRSAGHGPLGLRPGFALLWRAPDAQYRGSISRPDCPPLVVAFRHRSKQEPFCQLPGADSGIVPAFCRSLRFLPWQRWKRQHRDGQESVSARARHAASTLPSSSATASSTTSFTTACAGPACPRGGARANDADSWKLVLFIRHLPNLTPAELHDMERFNPKSEAEREEEKQEEDFLNGGPAGASGRKTPIGNSRRRTNEKDFL